MNYTPGPWIAVEDTHLYWIWALDAEGKKSTIPATISKTSQDPDQDAADAALIAAAPELLEAAKITVSYLKAIGLDTDEECNPAPEYAALMAAIAKTTAKAEPEEFPITDALLAEAQKKGDHE